MSRVVDLTAGDSEGAEILERTGSGGVIGSAYLHDRPLASYIAEEEAVTYVLRNKKSGLEVDGGADMASMTPDDDHQAFAVVTDVRLLFVVGSGDGDRVQRLPLADVLTARTESGGFRTTVLRIETQDDSVVTFPVRGDVEAVAEYVDRAAQVWAHAARTAEEAVDAVSTADRQIDASNYESAQHAVAGVESDLEAALSDLRGLGQGALTAYLSTAEDLVDDVNGVRRRAHAGRGAGAHATAQTAWENRDYEAAAGAYGDCIGAYAAAYQCTGDEPPDQGIRRRALGAAREREILRSAPLIDLLTAKHRAAAERDPATAAETWERALEFVRDLTALSWPDSDDRGFRLDSRTVREHAADCAEHAIDNRSSAARQWMSAGDRIAEGTLSPEATEAYERARIHLDRALALARELFPGRLDDLETSISALEGRLSGAAVPEPGDHLDAPLPNEPIEALSHEPEADTGPDIDAAPANDDAAAGPQEAPSRSPEDHLPAEATERAEAALETEDGQAGPAEAGTTEAEPEDVEPEDVEPEDVEPVEGEPAEVETSEAESSQAAPSPPESETADSTDPEPAPGEPTPPNTLEGDWQVPPTDAPPAEESAGETGAPSGPREPATDPGPDSSGGPDSSESDPATTADADPAEPPVDWDWHAPRAVDVDADEGPAEVAGDSGDSDESEGEPQMGDPGASDEPAEEKPAPPASGDSDVEATIADPAEGEETAAIDGSEEGDGPADDDGSAGAEATDEPASTTSDAEDSDVAGAMEATGKSADADDAEAEVAPDEAAETAPPSPDADDSDVAAALEATAGSDAVDEPDTADDSGTVSPDADDSDVGAALEGTAESVEGDEEPEAHVTATDSTSAHDSDVESAVAAAADGDDDDGPSAGDADADTPPSDDTPVTPDQTATAAQDEATLRRELRALDEGAFTDLVADLWEARGWSTMSFSASGGSVYDLVAVRGQPAGERLLLWTDHRPDGGTVPVRVVERIEATQERSEGGEALALVTSGRLTSEGRDRAEAADVDLYDAEAVVDALVDAGMIDRLRMEDG